MKLFSTLMALVLFFGQVSAFSPLFDDLDDAQSDITEQIDTSSTLLLNDIADFTKRTLQVDAYNNLVCLGLGVVTVDKSDIASLVTLLEERVIHRTEELHEAITLADGDDSIEDLPMVKTYYFNLLDTDVDTFETSYQNYLNDLSADIRETIEEDESRFAQLAVSNEVMLQKLTEKRAYLAVLNAGFDSFSSQLDEWNDFWSNQVEDVSLGDVVADELSMTLDAYFAQQHKQLTSLYPDLPYLISDLKSFEDDLKEELQEELYSMFDGYMGHYSIEDGESILLDREEFREAYYLGDGTMNCPVIVGGRHANLIETIESQLEEEKKLLAETVIAFDGFSSTSASVNVLSKQLDAWYAEFFADVVKGPYVTFKNKTLTQAQKDYQAEQKALSTVTLPYTKAQLLQALTAAAKNYSNSQTYHNLLEKSLTNIKTQLTGDLSDYQRALFTLLRDAITEYLAQ